MSYSCPTSADGFGFTQEEINETVSRNGLLSMEIEFSLACNFSCPYCYNDIQKGESELTSQEIDKVLLDAKELGARKIIILGGEPMIYPEIHDKIRFIRRHGMGVEMFTNGSCMTPENAMFMHDNGVAVVLKMNSFNPELQNRMAGRDDANEIIQSAYRNLRDAGYPSTGKRLAVSTVICDQNIDELPDLWRWLRKRDIEPYFEMITPQGGAADSDWIKASVPKQEKLFAELAEIDRNEFGHEWEPQPPLVGNVCLRHQFSCLVNAHGTVMPCVGVTIPLGNIRETSLKEILDKSEVLENLRDFPNRIKGPCRECEKSSVCYGCRGAAYQLTGDYLASDPTCWLNQSRAIDYLPADIGSFIPQQPPMRLVDTLLEVGERRARLQAEIKEDNPFLSESGTLDEAAYIELIAQSAAGLEGFHSSPGERERHQGFLIGAKKVEFSGAARVGDTLEIEIEKIGRFGEFGVIGGVIRRGTEEIARGQINIFKKEDDGEHDPAE